jgi:hypothetical protein
MTSAGLPGVQRDFTTFSAAAAQVEDARIYAGFHYRFSWIDGAKLGAQVGQLVLQRLMQPSASKGEGSSLVMPGDKIGVLWALVSFL